MGLPEKKGNAVHSEVDAPATSRAAHWLQEALSIHALAPLPSSGRELACYLSERGAASAARAALNHVGEVAANLAEHGRVQSATVEPHAVHGSVALFLGSAPGVECLVVLAVFRKAFPELTVTATFHHAPQE